MIARENLDERQLSHARVLVDPPARVLVFLGTHLEGGTVCSIVHTHAGRLGRRIPCQSFPELSPPAFEECSLPVDGCAPTGPLWPTIGAHLERPSTSVNRQQRNAAHDQYTYVR